MRDRKARKEPVRLSSPTALDGEALRERIARKAYEMYELRGCVDGHDQEDWLEAERATMSELEEKSIPQPLQLRVHAA